MPDVDLEFLAAQNERILAELAAIREDVRTYSVQLAFVRRYIDNLEAGCEQIVMQHRRGE